MKQIPVIVVFVMTVGLATDGAAIPNVWGVWTWDLSEPAHVMVLPNGGGRPLSEAVAFGGAVVDATVRVQLWIDANDDPSLPPNPQVVSGMPREDIWLEVPGMSACIGGAIADNGSDEEGWFTFSTSLGMGGANDPGDVESYPYVVVNGVSLQEEDGQWIRPSLVFNSPDLNADLSVNLTDVPVFAQDFWGEYRFRSDFNWDGRIDLSDVVWLAASQGAGCSGP